MNSSEPLVRSVGELEEADLEHLAGEREPSSVLLPVEAAASASRSVREPSSSRITAPWADRAPRRRAARSRAGA